MSEMAKSGFVHVAGPYENGFQCCVICGGIIVDHRDKVMGQGHWIACGFAEGPVTVNGCMQAAYADDDLPYCRPNGLEVKPSD